jgi:glycosyltransferase involved in cell wall biosynthesis
LDKDKCLWVYLELLKMSKNLNIAIVSPNKNSYSETFIQAQKERLKGNMFYYFNGFMPTKLEGHDDFIIKNGGLKKKLRLIGRDILAQSLENSFKQKKIDIVLAQYGPSGETVAPICEKLNIPLVVHFHGYDASVGDVISRYNNYKYLIKVARSVIVVSKVMYNKLLKLGCPEEKLCYNVYGANPDFQNIETKFSKKQALAIGRFTDKKAPYNTILAFKKIIKQHPDAKHIFAGKGELVEDCENVER